MDYKVAVVIPTLNEERFITRCLDSVMSQTYPFCEMDVMVVDGGSIDATKSIVKEVAEKWPNVRLIDNPGKIQSIAFNIGAKESRAPYIIRLDAHALYNNDYVEKCLADLKADCNRGNVGGRCVILPYDNSLWANTNAILNYSRFGIGGSAFRVGVTPQNVDSVPFGAFPRSVIEKVGGMKEHTGFIYLFFIQEIKSHGHLYL
jgi:glycosyltransferase involved in cell wall biosynthesis